MSNTLDTLCIDTVRCLAMDAVQKANSGHPGTPMALAPAGYILWTKFLKHNPSNPHWADRDRFVLSVGHASMLIYSLLHLTGYDVSLDDLKNFRQWGSKTAGHPEVHHCPGVETTTGPLGQGIGNAVGMAIAERYLASHFNRPGHEIVNHRTFAFAGDGDVMEGVAQEAASLAGHLGLEKLVLLYDNNNITIEGSTELAFTEEVDRRFQSYGWRVIKVGNGEDLWALEKAFEEAMKPCGKPTLIDCRTVIGFPAPTRQGTAKAHGEPLGKDEVAATKTVLGWDPNLQFHVPADAQVHWSRIAEQGASQEAEWDTRSEAYCAEFPELAAEFQRWMKGDLGDAWKAALPAYTPEDAKMATREASGKILNAIAPHIPFLVGGSADLAPSTITNLKDGGSFSRTESGRNFHWGIREHGMGACLNGMSLHGGLRPFGATFLIFTDYMRPAMRLAALMGQPIVYVMTHDSIGLGEDGPTHQPVEQIMSLRLIPNMQVLRPADARETVGAWTVALERKDGPTVLALTRQKLPVLEGSSAEAVAMGGYVLRDSTDLPEVILMATGSEVALAVEAADRLEAEGTATRVVSLPSMERFLAQTAAYRESVLPSGIEARVAIEAGVSWGWERLVGNGGAIIGLDRFGASAPAEVLFEKFGFTVDNVVATARRVMGA